MKATGIVRRIDDLGRVVIPKEIRRTMRIREGDPLEIYTNAGGEVIFKKYSPIGELSVFATQYAEVMGAATKLPIIICDRDRCIAAAGISKKEALERKVTPELETIINERKSVNIENEKLSALEGIDRGITVASPIIAAGDVCGAVVLLQSETGEKANDSDMKLVSVAAAFLGRQVES
ncbi:MAG: AbrB/MazE/SpoVT family DNA-binding domain-containing protein [Clostridia bacterium]|nr:AbrB/MazE/SpoVT family DNA-binding domain-containing protein [Clostridia bacterium]